VSVVSLSLSINLNDFGIEDQQGPGTGVQGRFCVGWVCLDLLRAIEKVKRRNGHNEMAYT